jgi:hypothetical protein
MLEYGEHHLEPLGTVLYKDSLEYKIGKELAQTFKWLFPKKEIKENIFSFCEDIDPYFLLGFEQHLPKVDRTTLHCV